MLILAIRFHCTRSRLTRNYYSYLCRRHKYKPLRGQVDWSRRYILLSFLSSESMTSEWKLLLNTVVLFDSGLIKGQALYLNWMFYFLFPLYFAHYTYIAIPMYYWFAFLVRLRCISCVCYASLIHYWWCFKWLATIKLRQVFFIT